MEQEMRGPSPGLGRPTSKQRDFRYQVPSSCVKRRRGKDTRMFWGQQGEAYRARRTQVRGGGEGGRRGRRGGDKDGARPAGPHGLCVPGHSCWGCNRPQIQWFKVTVLPPNCLSSHCHFGALVPWSRDAFPWWQRYLCDGGWAQALLRPSPWERGRASVRAELPICHCWRLEVS